MVHPIVYIVTETWCAPALLLLQVDCSVLDLAFNDYSSSNAICMYSLLSIEAMAASLILQQSHVNACSWPTTKIAARSKASHTQSKGHGFDPLTKRW